MSTPDHLERPIYTTSQLLAYYDHINLPSQHRHAPGAQSRSIARGPTAAALAFLSALQLHTLCTIPFENLDLHYSPYHANSIDPHAIFSKVVTRGKGRGGYCMENNNLFGTVLRSLGFDVYPTGARVNGGIDGGGEKYGGWSHMVNIVTIGEQRYLVDVGFGGAAASPGPLLLKDGHEAVQIKPQTLRLRYTKIPDNTSSRLKLWLFEVRHAEEKTFLPCYCFNPDIEFLPADFKVMNHYTSTSRTSFFTYKLLVVKVFMGEDGEVGEMYIMSEVQVKKRAGGVAEDVMSCKSDEERVHALRKYFGIELSEIEQRAIEGMVSQIG